MEISAVLPVLDEPVMTFTAPERNETVRSSPSKLYRKMSPTWKLMGALPRGPSPSMEPLLSHTTDRQTEPVGDILGLRH